MFHIPTWGVEIISTYFSVWLWIVTQFNTPKNEMCLKALLVIGNCFLISTWKYWIWISKNEGILRNTAWKRCCLLFCPKLCLGCHFATLFQLEKYRLVHWINVREWPNYTLTSQQFWKLTNNGLQWCKFKIHITSCLSIIKH